MRTTIIRAALILLGGSALAFAASVYVFSSWNTLPLSLPVPSDSAWVKEPIHLTTSGAFRLRITVPARSPSGIGTVLHWRGSACLQFALNPTGSVDVAPAKVDAFRSAGVYEFGGLAYFESEDTFQIDRGDHMVALRACEAQDNEQLFIELVRAGNPTDQVFAATTVRGLGWVLFVLGTAAALGSALVRNNNENAV